eukprot:5549880-Pyramimonas_sp.AAC.1
MRRGATQLCRFPRALLPGGLARAPELRTREARALEAPPRAPAAARLGTAAPPPPPPTGEDMSALTWRPRPPGAAALRTRRGLLQLLPRG